MKLDDSIIDQFNLEPEDDREPVNVMRVSELLDFLKESATRIVSKSQQYFSTEDADIQADCLDIVGELLLRNEITHDYFNREIHLRKLIALMQNYSEGALDVYKQLAMICQDRGLLDKYVDKNARL